MDTAFAETISTSYPETTSQSILSHPVRNGVKEAVGVPESEPVALMIHVTNSETAKAIQHEGFVNVSGRGTLASMLDNPHPDQEVGVPSIVRGKTDNIDSGVSIITFCLPSRLLKPDESGNYGMWFDNPLQANQHPALHDAYQKIAILYDQNGNPTQFAKDDPTLYPVFIPPQYILGIASSSG